MTDDPSRYAPPLEFRLPLGTLVDTASPAPEVPAPYAVTGGGPGMSTGAAKPPVAPTLPDFSDPQQVMLLMSQLAGEHLVGSSIVPAPAPAQASSGVGLAAPVGGGFAPTLVPANAEVPGADPTTPATTAVPSTMPSGAAPTSIVPATPVPSSSPFGAPIDFGAIIDDPMHFTLPVLNEPSMSDDLYFVPSADVLGLESGGGRVEAYEPAARDDNQLVRDLGGNAFDPYVVRRDFPILEERVHGGKRLVWLDNAATTQKPRAVIDRISYFYEHENSNVHRAAHTLAARSTDAFERARESARRFLNAPSAKEIVWVRGATEGINLIAQSWGRRYIGEGDEIVITHLEHHANIVPWQMLCAEKGARLKVAPVDDRGDVILEQYEKLLGPRTKLVSIPQVSNALGTITPTQAMVEMAHRYGAHVLVDGAQAVSHMRVDVQALGCDWYVFSGHKVYAPTGIGVVWGRQEVLEATPPWQGGGNMIEDVTFEKTKYQPPPMRFEAGTGSIGDAVGLGAAIEYCERIGMDVIDRYEHELLVYGTERLATVPGLHMIGTSPNKAGVLSFVLDGQRTEDVSSILDKDGIAVRSGHHCAQPILRRFGLEATVRASLAFYNVREDLDALVDALHRLQAGPG
jgi:cysteine desulfurase/selenocysteine lyase